MFQSSHITSFSEYLKIYNFFLFKILFLAIWEFILTAVSSIISTTQRSFNMTIEISLYIALLFTIMTSNVGTLDTTSDLFSCRPDHDRHMSCTWVLIVSRNVVIVTRLTDFIIPCISLRSRVPLCL